MNINVNASENASENASANAIQMELPNIIDHKLETYLKARLSDWRLEIIHDDYVGSPRVRSTLGVIFAPSGCRYMKSESDLDWDSICEGNRERDRKALEKLGYIVYPLSVYDHSRVSIYIGGSCDKWDSGQIGWYLVSKSDVYKEYGCKRISPKLRAKLDKIVEGEIELYSDWYNGETWVYNLFKGDEFFDSRGGFIGSNQDEVFEEMWENIPSEFTDAFTKEEAKAMAEEKGLWFSY